MALLAAAAVSETAASQGCGYIVIRSSHGTGPAAVDQVREGPPPGRPILGAAVDWDKLRQPGAYQRLFLAHYRSLTPELVMKMDALAPTPDEFAFGPADDLVRWAKQHGIVVHGHTLVWHNQLPGWLSSRSWTRDGLRAYLKRYIQTVVGHFRGRVPSWDVVNEPLAEDGSLRPSIWRQVLGDDYIADAFRWAHEADPNARLYINEYNVEESGAKAEGMFRLLGKLKRQGVPVDAIGLQAHLTSTWHPTGKELRELMRRYADLGLGVDISEMDVAVGSGQAALDQQARIYGTVAAACEAQPACEHFTTWGFTDASTWLGSDKRPLPFASDGSTKPAWRAISAAL